MDIKISDEKQENTDKKQDCNENENVLSPSSKLNYGRLQDLPKTLYGLLKNLPFMGITLGATMDGFLLAGIHVIPDSLKETLYQRMHITFTFCVESKFNS